MKWRVAAAFLVVSALLAGCSVLPGRGGGSDGSGTNSDGRMLDLPERTVYSRGDAVDPSAGITTGPSARAPLASLSPLPSSTWMMPTPSFSPTECTGMVHPGVVNGLTVVAGTTSAVVTWWNVGDPAVSGYQLAAVSQRLYFGPQAGWTWQSIAPGRGCTRMSATVTGLLSQTPYVFVLHALLRKYESLPPAAPEVARSEAVTTL